MSRRTKARAAAKTGKVMIEHPQVRRAAKTVAVPAAKRKIKASSRQRRKQLEQIGDSAGTALTSYGLPAAEALGLYEPPKAKATTPRVAAGFLAGVALMFLLDPSSGTGRRARLRKIIGSSPAEPPATDTD